MYSLQTVQCEVGIRYPPHDLQEVLLNMAMLEEPYVSILLYNNVVTFVKMFTVQQAALC